MRKLTLRERVLLVILAVLAAICAYVFLFHLPMERRAADYNARIQQSQAILDQTDALIARQRAMERELEALRAADPAPVPMPDYDNIQAVMVELNGILSDALEYTLRFSSAEGENGVMARRVTVPFTCAGYADARAILQRVHDSALRCRLGDVSITEGEDGAVQVVAEVIFYEYQAAPAGE